MNHPQVNGEMGQGKKQKQQVGNRGNHSGGNLFLFQEDPEGERECLDGGWGFPAVRCYQKHVQAPLAEKEGGCRLYGPFLQTSSDARRSELGQEPPLALKLRL